MAWDSNVAQFYSRKCVFITGATGFMGKVLVEKLLRSCPDVDRIYLLLRPAKGKDVSDRMEALINNRIFDLVRSSGVLSKLTVVAGDVKLPGFGLSDEDLQVIVDNVSVVFHSAATVNFNEDLKSAVEMNVNGPRHLLAVCKRMKRLEAVVHVSTAFCNPEKEEADEVIYPPPDTKTDPVKLVELINSLPNELVNKWTPDLIVGHPNTYTFTKAMAERILERERGDLPLAIFRPSIVMASVSEPYPGWVDNLNGPTGMLAVGGKGVLRVLKGKSDAIANVIPVDLAINMLIVVARQTALSRKNAGTTSIPVYHCCTSSSKNRMEWISLGYPALEIWRQYPCAWPKLWYPDGGYCSSELMWWIKTTYHHTVPAYVIDFVLFLVGRERLLVRLYDKIHRVMRAVDFFVSRQWGFATNNLTDLWNSSSLTDTDREIFNFDPCRIDWDSYVKDYVLGVRRYIFKEELPARDELVPAKPSDAGWHPWMFASFYFLLFLFVLLCYYLVKFGLMSFF